MEIYLTLWMWWRMWQTYTTTMTQMMMTVMMTTLMMKTPLPKTNRIPILPTHKWDNGGYGQRLSHIIENDAKSLSSTSKVTYKTIFITLFKLFSIGDSFKFKATREARLI